MKTVSLAFSLLWRMVVALNVLGLVFLLVLIALHAIGLDFIMQEITSSGSFIKLKPTLLYASTACALLIIEYGFRINIVRLVWGKRVSLSEVGWHRFITGLAVLFFVLATLNALVAVLASNSFWVNYKVFGGNVLFLAGYFLLVGVLKSQERP